MYFKMSGKNTDLDIMRSILGQIFATGNMSFDLNKKNELTKENTSAGQANIMSPTMSDMAIFVAVAFVMLAGSYAAITSVI